MLKTLGLVGALAVAGLAFAGTATADCMYEQPGLMPGDYLSICTLEYYEYAYPPYYEGTQNTPVSTYYFGSDAEGYLYQSSGVSQGTFESCWGSVCDSSSSTNVYNSVYKCEWSSGCSGANVNMGQNAYESDSGYSYKSFGVNAEVAAGGDNLYMTYNQGGSNGSCSEQSYFGGSITGFNQVITPQPCGAEMVPVPTLPAL